MKVVLYGILRSIAGKKEFPSKASTIGQLLEELSKLFGRKMQKYLYDQDTVESLTVVLNGKVISKSEKAKIHIHEEDIVELLSPIGGG